MNNKKKDELKYGVEKLINLGNNYKLESKFYFILTSIFFFYFIKLGLC